MFGLYSNPYFDRSVVLTSATEGLGPALARALIARGAKVIAIDSRHEALERLSEELGAGFVTLARDLAEPAAPVEIARWLADEHRDIGGLVCNAAAGDTEGMNRRLFAPLSILGFLGSLLPERRDLKVALILPASHLGKDIARVSAVTHGLGVEGGRKACLTAALLSGDAAEDSDAARRRAADLVLDALAKGWPTVRVRSWAGLPTHPRNDRNAEKQGERLA
jgi:hypothetical protein